MPYLGFDPAPGDVALTHDLARRYFEVGQELDHVVSLVGHLDLAPWQGRAGDAMRTVQGTLPPALEAIARTVRELQSVASSWAAQLSGFQAEADVLERKAAAARAQQQALRTKVLAGSRSAALNGDLEAASSALSGIQAQAQELHQRYLTAAQKTAGHVDEKSGLWGKTEPVRTVLEAVLAPLDMAAADHWVSALEKVAGFPRELVSELGVKIDDAEALMHQGKTTEAMEALVKAGYSADRVGAQVDAWDAFAPGWLRASAQSLSEVRGLSYTLAGLGIVADMGTLISPQDSGALGWVDRSAGLVNGSLLSADLVMAELPVVGDVAIAATGIYLAGDYLYHHWTPFHDVANDVGHATVKVADNVGHAAGSAWHSITSSIGSWF